MFSFLTQNLLWSQGIGIVLVNLVLISIGFFYSRILLVGSLVFLAFSLFFFRNPARTPLVGNNVILSPSDGVITSIFHVSDDSGGLSQKISIFLSPLDVHVNRAPFDGSVQQVLYTPGTFLFAFLPKSSELNEHNDVWFSDTKGRIVRVRQIAGFIARRICCWVSPTQSVTRGEPFGMIKFGSRVDLFLPSTVQITCEVGQYIWGGESIIGTWKK